jgi:hypothetical protein
MLISSLDKPFDSMNPPLKGATPGFGQAGIAMCRHRIAGAVILDNVLS